MPCLVLCGHPCSGKSRLAELIRTRALAMDNSCIDKVVVVNEASACPDQSIDACYKTSEAEKFTRGALKSSFDRYVSSGVDGGSTLVILDSMNYIKGFRYELHCISKAAGQKHGVVWVLNEGTICKQWNKKRRESMADTDASQSYSDALMDELMLRFEPPDMRNRWDRPLYRIDVRPPGEKQRSSLAKEALEQSVYNMHKLSDAIDESAFTETTKKASTTFKRTSFKKPVRPNIATTAANQSDKGTTTADTAQPTEDTPLTQEKERERQTVEEQVDHMLDSFVRNVEPLKEGMSTKQHVSSGADVLHNADSITLKVCSLITVAQNKSTTAGGRLSISINNDDEPIWFDFNRRISLPELRRLRRQYIQWVAVHPPEDSSERGVAVAFMTYIAAQ